MHILTVLYGQPDDPAAFDQHYKSTHAPLAEKIPGVQSFTYRHLATLDGSQPPYYLIAEVAFDSLESLQSGLQTPEGQAATEDVPNFATGGATLLVAHD
ncbi:EthD family reductase [Actinomycetospora sp. TBRC 11914]|uniref:EthD family reductase n=1 Tax=Actinomycetospora sp. TBRC 11914 TaxID=2729387 RepID=UPI00145E98A9|nr:EthD family reductase [Actinomycetospora sp. TBRC 11914]NMO90498.1 EthD family reductase [Actinomycetospora sp. TBRC 11914]